MHRFMKTIFLLTFILILSSCKEKVTESREPVAVKTITAIAEENFDNLETYGSVIYKKKNTVTSLVDGTIVELWTQEGSAVKKGAPLLKLKNVQYEIKKIECQNALNSAQARVRSARNNLIESEKQVNGQILEIENLKTKLFLKEEELKLQKKQFEKNEKLFMAGGISENAREQLLAELQNLEGDVQILQKEIAIQEMGFKTEWLEKAGVIASENIDERKRQIIDLNLQSAKIQIELALTEEENAKQNLRSIESLMDNLIILSPADGIIGQLNFERGEHVVENEKLLTIIDMKEPYAQVLLQEKDCQKVFVGSPALIKINSLNEEQKSYVSFISPLADYESGNFKLKIPLENENNKIKLGMFIQCEIKTNEKRKIFKIPKEAAIRIHENTATLFFVQKGYLFQKNCPIEFENENWLFISKGIEEGEKILAHAQDSLKEGQYVKEI